jgi:hypothetical protein
MSKPQPLTPTLISVHSPEYQDIWSWPFSKRPFYEGQVIRLLQDDLPQRKLYDSAFGVWLYRDQNNDKVGFGALAV